MIATLTPDSTPSPTKTAGLRILIAEDMPDCAESMTMLLDMYGHQVEVAREGLTALELAIERQPDVLLLDIGLPGLDGFQVAQRFKGHCKDQKTIIIALTGYGQERDVQRSVESGIDLHLTKPVEPQHLRELLSRIEQLQKILTTIPDIIAECRSLR